MMQRCVFLLDERKKCVTLTHFEGNGRYTFAGRDSNTYQLSLRNREPPYETCFHLLFIQWTRCKLVKRRVRKAHGEIYSCSGQTERGGTRYRPFAFTEQGVVMLSSVLEELKQRMKMLEEGNEDTIAAINDLSEDTRNELGDIYLALSQLA